MIEKRAGLAVVGMPDGFYAIGGFNGSYFLDSFEKYSLKENK